MKALVAQLKSLARNGFFHILVGGTLTKVIGFLTSIALVRLLAKDDFAYLTYTDTLYSYLLMFLGVGMGSAFLKFGTAANDSRNRAYLAFAFKWGSLVQLGFCVAFVAVIEMIPLDFPAARVLLLSLIGYPLVYYWTQLGQNYLRIKLLNRLYAWSGLVQTALILLLNVALVLPFGLLGVAWARYFALIVVLVLLGAWMIPRLRRDGHEPPPPIDRKQFVFFSLSLLVANLFSQIMPINEAYLVAHIVHDESATANYKVATLIPSQLIFVTSAIVTYVFPKFTQLERGAPVWNQAKQAGRLCAGVLVALSVLGFAVTPLILRLVYGSAYADAIALSLIMWLPNMMNSAFRMLPMNLLPALGHTRFNAVVSVVSCVVHFALDYWMISAFGVAGVAYASGFIYAVSAVLYWVRLRKVALEY